MTEHCITANHAAWAVCMTWSSMSLHMTAEWTWRVRPGGLFISVSECRIALASMDSLRPASIELDLLQNPFVKQALPCMVWQIRAEAAEAEASRLEDEIDGVSSRLEAAESELAAARAMTEAIRVSI